MEVVEHVAFRVTRDADFRGLGRADELLEVVELELRRRPVRRRRPGSRLQARQRRA